MNGCYIANRKLEEFDGVSKKIVMQINALRRSGIECSYICVGGKYRNVLSRKVISRLPFTTINDDWKRINICDDIDFVYLRHPYIDRGFIRFLKGLKEKKKLIIMEFPTYPYDLEYGIRSYPYLIKERFWRKKIHKYLDYIVTYSSDMFIFDTPCINVINGIEMDSVSPINNIRTNKEIHMIAVSTMKVWHGYERLIRGLANYYHSEDYNNRIIKLHLVGEGPEMVKYRKIVKENNISEYVLFYGQLSGGDLDEVYEKCNVAVSSLAFHRTNVHLSSALKTREYAAKGLPIISSCKIDAFPIDECDFIKMVPEDESDINIAEIVTFYDKLIHEYKSGQELAFHIRENCCERCNIDSVLKPVVEVIQNFSKQ